MNKLCKVIPHMNPPKSGLDRFRFFCRERRRAAAYRQALREENLTDDPKDVARYVRGRSLAQLFMSADSPEMIARKPAIGDYIERTLRKLFDIATRPLWARKYRAAVADAEAKAYEIQVLRRQVQEMATRVKQITEQARVEAQLAQAKSDQEAQMDAVKVQLEQAAQ